MVAWGCSPASRIRRNTNQWTSSFKRAASGVRFGETRSSRVKNPHSRTRTICYRFVAKPQISNRNLASGKQGPNAKHGRDSTSVLLQCARNESVARKAAAANKKKQKQKSVISRQGGRTKPD